MLQSLGQLYLRGVKVDWLGFDQDYSRQKVVLLTYPWQRKRYWITDIQEHKNQGKKSVITQSEKQKLAETNMPVQKIETNGQKISHQSKLRLSKPELVSLPKAGLRIEQTPKRELIQLKFPSKPSETTICTQNQQHLETSQPSTLMNTQQIAKLKEEYTNKGYCKISNFFNLSEIAKIQETLERAKNGSQISQEEVSLKLARYDEIETKDHAYDLVRYDFVSSLIKSKLPFLNEITGKKIMIMHNALFSVEPNKKGLNWHVGVGSFSFTKMEDFGASIWIPLDEIKKEYRGGMQYVSTKIFPGQFFFTLTDLHLKNNLDWDESKGDLNEYVANANTILNKITEDVLDYTIKDNYEEDEYKVGDVLFFNKYVLHRSVPLKPGLHKLRRAFVIRLVDYDTRVDEERLGLFSKYSQLHSRVYKTLPRYNKDSVLVMVSRSIKRGLKSPYLRDITYIQKTLSERIAVEPKKIAVEPENIAIKSENISQTPNISPSNSSEVDITQIKEALKESLAESLYADISEIEEDQKFIDLGLDSIVGVEWITTINQIYNLNIKATKLYDYPTLLELTEYIAQNLSSQGQNIQVNHQKSSQTEVNISNQSQQPLETLQLSTKFQVNLLEVKEVLKQQLAEALYIEISEIEEDQKFIDLGLDSIVGVEWITTINQTYNLNIKATKLYDYPTLLDLAEYITEEISSKNRNELSQGNQYSPEESPQNQDLSKESQEDIRQKIRPILNKVANHKLTIQEAKQMIQEIKQQSKAENDLQESSIKNNQIFELIKKYTYDIVPELAKVSLKPTDSLQQLEIDSMNRAEIIMMVMEELDLHIQLIELAGAKNIGELADLFAAKLEVNHGF